MSLSSSKKLKKKMKLLKALSRDITVFSDMGFGLASDLGLAGEVKGKMISDAAELLLAQLQKLKATEKELKRKKKLEKSKMKARQVENRVYCEVSSSSSSESSDSECGEVVDMSRLKEKSLAQPALNELIPDWREEPNLGLPNTPVLELLQPVSQEPTGPPTEEECNDERVFGEQPGPTTTSTCCRTVGSTGTCCNIVNNMATTTRAGEKKIEVCMGGKCRKSGAAALLEQFQRIVGTEGAVVGCKCMGKCKDGPNVRVLNHLDRSQDDSTRAPSNPLCIGVGFEDVDVIVSNFLGKAHQDLGLAAAAAAASSST